ncbi:MAG TPA: hypothetical protein VKC66_23865 [Xanthobacteraceae bacterium]|nr:hypothetical protein [Xanthobacteraceae bacterium]
MGEFRTFTGETPIRTRHEEENLNGKPQREEEKVHQHDAAPSCRNLLKQLSKCDEKQGKGSHPAGPQPAQRVGWDRWLKKLRWQRLRRSRHGFSSRLRHNLNTILIQKTKVGRVQRQGLCRMTGRKYAVEPPMDPASILSG